ncbi:hydrophobic protein [Nocardia sp. ET3-3]|uniref:Hydrophobic protein n=1 Tax=Nocardia terrae TaxID=2675851 RepID=A0A7K1UP21_9NOCA|nr:hydrophobic protein [Nocardia terrae]MVU76086.1 hydrophobic protein [Nocardia terrae]
MAVLLLVLLLALLFVGLGFLLKVLWWVAIVVLLIWVLGFVFRSADAAGSRRRWYRW